MRARLAWLMGAAGLAALLRGRSSRRAAVAPPPEQAPLAAADPWAEELRRRLEASRTAAESGPAAPEVPEPEQPEADLEARRRRVHERGRAAVDDMRGPADR